MYKPSITTCAGLLGLCAGLNNKICADIWHLPKWIHRHNGGKEIYLSGRAGNIYHFNLENANRIMRRLKRKALKRGDFGAHASGSSCQGMSRLNPKRHPFDPRNFLMFEQVRIVKEFMPDYAIWEQVPGLMDDVMTPFRDMLFNLIKKELSADYHWVVQPMNAMHYGGTQDRERLIFMLVRKDLGKDPLFPEPQPVQPIQLLSNLIPGVVAYKSDKSWQNANNVIGTLTRGGVKLRFENGETQNMSIEQKKGVAGFGHLNFDIPGIREADKHILIGNSVAYQFGYNLQTFCQKTYWGMDL